MTDGELREDLNRRYGFGPTPEDLRDRQLSPTRPEIDGVELLDPTEDLSGPFE